MRCLPVATSFNWILISSIIWWLKKKKEACFINEFSPGSAERDLETRDAVADILEQITWTESCQLFNGNPYSSQSLFLPRAKDRRSQVSISSYPLRLSRAHLKSVLSHLISHAPLFPESTTALYCIAMGTPWTIKHVNLFITEAQDISLNICRSVWCVWF